MPSICQLKLPNIHSGDRQTDGETETERSTDKQSQTKTNLTPDLKHHLAKWRRLCKSATISGDQYRPIPALHPFPSELNKSYEDRVAEFPRKESVNLRNGHKKTGLK